ncbi:MAG: hypothetical protein MZV70_37730 [Desulfobacterales bacterium]|nr:hypothetical protein [Desulfobacterales bacterium]
MSELQAPLVGHQRQRRAGALCQAAGRAHRTGRDGHSGAAEEHGGRSGRRPRRSRPGGQPAADPGADGADERFEQRIIAMMLQFPEILPEVVDRGILELFHARPD